jgi:hypothetical protein
MILMNVLPNSAHRTLFASTSLEDLLATANPVRGH